MPLAKGKRNNSNGSLSNEPRKVIKVNPASLTMDPVEIMDKGDPLESKFLEIIDYLKKKVTLRVSSFTTEDLNYVVRLCLEGHSIRVGEKFAENRLMQCLETKLDSTKESLAAICSFKESALAEIAAAKTTPLVNPSQPEEVVSYRSVAARKVSSDAPIPNRKPQVASNKVSQKLIKRNKFAHSVQIKPLNSLTMSTDEVEAILTREVCTSKTQIKVKNVSKNKNSIFVNCDDKESAESLEQVIKTNPELNKVMETSPTTALLPTIGIHNISKAISADEVINYLVFNYPEFSQFESQFSFLYAANGDKFRSQSVFYRVTPAVLTMFQNMDMLVRIGLNQCRIQLKYLVRQCQSCFSFKHTTKYCDKAELGKVCLVCAEQISPNSTHTCSGQMCCFNCKNSTNKSLNKKTNHSVKSLNCPLFKSQFSNLISRTNLVNNV